MAHSSCASSEASPLFKPSPVYSKHAKTYEEQTTTRSNTPRPDGQNEIQKTPKKRPFVRSQRFVFDEDTIDLFDSGLLKDAWASDDSDTKVSQEEVGAIYNLVQTF